MIFQVFESGVLATNTMVLGCKASLHAVIIDPAKGCSSEVDEFLTENKLIPKKILLTHSHWDHTGDVLFFKEKYDIPVFVHKKDAENLQHPGSDGVDLFVPMKSVRPDVLLEGGEKIELGSLELEVIHTPGHSPGSVCYWLEKEEILISGDTLFKGSIGNISFPSSNSEDMWESLKKLAKLPASARVYPGHMGTTTIGMESWLDNAKNIFS